MTYFDEKQTRLITSWHNLSIDSKDAYMAFIAEWIAFNAICYNLYYENAVRERATIDRHKSKLKSIQERLNQSHEVLAEKAKINYASEKWNIDLSFPERLFISISNNYTEDNIFNEYVIVNGKWYNENILASFGLFDALHKSLKKELKNGPRHFVINMSKNKFYNESFNIDEMAGKNIVVLCESNDLKTIKDVLYQIRCNIFHGEKTPGDINDDRIVKSALPVLKYIVTHLINNYKIY